MEEKQREVSQEALDHESCEKKIWKERLRKEILREENERIKNYLNSLVKEKILEVEKLLEIVGKPAKLVLVPIIPQSEERGIASDGELISTDTGTDPSFVVGDPKSDENIDASKLGLGLELGLEKDDVCNEDSREDLDVQCLDNGESYISKLGLGLEKDNNCEDSEKDLDEKFHDNVDHGESDGLKLGLGLEKNNDIEDSKKNNVEPEKIRSPRALKISSEGNSQSEKRKFTISKVHLRPTKKQKAQEWKCFLCDIIATSETNLAAHFKGKRHLTKSSQIVNRKPMFPKSKTKEAGNAINLEVNGKLHVVVEKSDSIFCEICEWNCASKTEMALHLCGTEHEHRSNENRKTES